MLEENIQYFEVKFTIFWSKVISNLEFYIQSIYQLSMRE